MFLEVINQTASTTGDVISTRLGKRVNFAPAQPCEPPPEADYAIQIVLAFEGSDYAMARAPNAALMDAVSAMSPGASLPAVAAPAPAAAPPSAFGPESGPASAAGAAANLDLLMEVELPLCVAFGRTQLPLKDVLKLSSGSIVELNRLVNEPVEVLINNHIIARGMVPLLPRQNCGACQFRGAAGAPQLAAFLLFLLDATTTTPYSSTHENCTFRSSARSEERRVGKECRL